MVANTILQDHKFIKNVCYYNRFNIPTFSSSVRFVGSLRDEINGWHQLSLWYFVWDFAVILSLILLWLMVMFIIFIELKRKGRQGDSSGIHWRREDKLQRLQWIPRLSPWRPFRFCVWGHYYALWEECRVYPIKHTLGMMTSSNGINFRVTGPLCGEFTGHQWISLTKASDAELWRFLWSVPE